MKHFLGAAKRVAGALVLPWRLACRRYVEKQNVHNIVGRTNRYCYAEESGDAIPREAYHADLPRVQEKAVSLRGSKMHSGQQFSVVRSPSLPSAEFHSLCLLSPLAVSTAVPSRWGLRFQHSKSSTQFLKPTDLRTPVSRVAVVGRDNVGKSSLYNHFISVTSCTASRRTQRALVGPDPGTTRDRKEALWGSLELLVTDTTGMAADFDFGDRAMIQHRNEQVTRALEASDVILFLVDAKEGVTPTDERFARRILRPIEETHNKGSEVTQLDQPPGENGEAQHISHGTQPPAVILVVNEAEGLGVANCLADAYNLKLGHPVLVSTKNNQGLDELYDRVRSALEARKECLQAFAEKHSGDESSDGSGYGLEEKQVGGIPSGVADAVRAVPPVQAALTEAWLEGLARRYGRGVKPILGHEHTAEGCLRLPWSLEKAPPKPKNSETQTGIQWEMLQDASKNQDLPMLEGDVQNDEEIKELDETGREETDVDIETERRIPRCYKLLGSNSEPVRLTFIGRPNAGKSSLINSILREHGLTVSSAPGTTTDSVCVEFSFKKQQMVLTDTAGVTRGWKMRGDDMLLQASMRTKRNIRGSDVCVLCLDAAYIQESGHISSNDLSLANLASEKEGRCLVVCVTKWDLVDPSKHSHVRTMILERLQRGLGHIKSCPVVFTSATQAHNLNNLLNKALLVYKQWCSHVSTAKLNAWLQYYNARWSPPWRLGSQCQVKYITQAQARPPTFVGWSNVYAHFPTHYKRQLINAIREEFGMKGVPVRLVLRTTAMPKPGTKLTKEEVLKWKRLGPHQHQAASKLSRKYVIKTKI